MYNARETVPALGVAEKMFEDLAAAHARDAAKWTRLNIGFTVLSMAGLAFLCLDPVELRFSQSAIRDVVAHCALAIAPMVGVFICMGAFQKAALLEAKANRGRVMLKAFIGIIEAADDMAPATKTAVLRDAVRGVLDLDLKD